MTELEARRRIIAACRAMNAAGLNQGTSGNISLRHGGAMLITPSATPYDLMQPEMIASMPLDGASGDWSGPLPPSTEWRFHRDLLRSRSDAAAVVHAHPPYCTALAITRRPIPACHYMVAAFGGGDVRCADYALFGTAALSAAVIEAMAGRNACLMANHGALVCAGSLARAMWLAVELETLARQYVLSLQLGGPVLLSDAQVEEAREQFRGYGSRD